MSRLLAAAALAALLFGGGPSAGSPSVGDPSVGAAGPARVAPVNGTTTGAPVRYSAPVRGALHVVRGFEPPPTPYSAGHRGVDLAVAPGAPVRAAGDGTVSFAGQVAGRGVVVVAHADGVRTEYEPVTPTVVAGQSVRRGQVIGHVRGTHGSCAPGRCLHWGARRSGAYFDPLTLLTPLGPVRLLPWNRR